MYIIDFKDNSPVGHRNIVADIIPQHEKVKGAKEALYIEAPEAIEFQRLGEFRYRQNSKKKWEIYREIVTLDLAEAKRLKKQKLSELFKQDVEWTDEELQFYQKRKGINDNSYGQWWQAVSTYHSEAYTEKQRAQSAVGAAGTLQDLRLVSYNSTHANTKESLQTPYQNRTQGN